MATVLNKELKRQVTVEGAEYTVTLGPDGVRLTGKGKRKPEVELRWRELLSGEAALAVALNASLSPDLKTPEKAKKPEGRVSTRSKEPKQPKQPKR